MRNTQPLQVSQQPKLGHTGWKVGGYMVNLSGIQHLSAHHYLQEQSKSMLPAATHVTCISARARGCLAASTGCHILTVNPMSTAPF